MTSPTQLTLKRLRRDGWLAEVTERWNPYGGARVMRDGVLKPVGNRVDLYGCIDVLAVRSFVHGPDAGILGVQCTSRANQSARLKKAMALPALHTFLAGGGRFQVWGWKKIGRRWEVTIRAVAMSEVERPKVAK